MNDEVKHLNLAGQLLTFQNPRGLYPVNQYQSLLLATASEFAAVLLATRQDRPITDLSAWEPCCGGGPAAIALKRLGLGYVQATDVNPHAVDACRANASKNDVELDRTATASMLEDGETRRYDLIACNPPCGVAPRANYAEQDALDVAVHAGLDGLDLTRELLTNARSRLTPGGSLLFVVVSTGNVRRLARWLDAEFGGRWRTFPCTPVAAPYAPAGDARVEPLLDTSLDFRPMVWKRSDGWYWRLSWIVEASTGGTFFPASAGSADARARFVMCPFGYEVCRDPALTEMIREFSADGFWLD
jgi:predicted RNA methylase